MVRGRSGSQGSLTFLEEECRGLRAQQKDLSREVMTDNYLTLSSLGLTASSPEIVVKIEKGEEPCVTSAGDRMVSGAGSGDALRGDDLGAVCGQGGGPGLSPRRSLRLVTRNSGEKTEGRRRSKPITKSAASPPGHPPAQDGSVPRTPDPDGAPPPSLDLSECGPAPPERLHTCDRCGESWSRLIDFLTHQMGGCQDRPHRCSICAKTFAKKQHLTAHRRTHTEDRPYTCHQCGRSFRQNSTLTTHLWSHAGHKPFHCSCCPKSFSRKTDLVAHMRRHTGERPYQCPYCWDRFIRKKSLQRHLLKHSGENPHSSPTFMERNAQPTPEPTPEVLTATPEVLTATSEPTPELGLRWDTERRAELPYGERSPALQGLMPPADPVKSEEEEEKPGAEAVTRTEQSTQTENKRPNRLQQEMLRELKSFRRSVAQAQHERDLMRSAMEQMAQEMKELKEMVASLCSPSGYRPSPSTIFVQNACPVWSRHSTESSRASPESSLQCGREQVSWMYESAPQEEDDMLPSTTIKREEEEEEEELSPEDYDSCRIGERLPNIPLQPLTPEKEWSLLARSAGKPGRFAALVFRALVPFDIYKGWVNRVNLDGLRGRQGIPLNVKRRVMAVVERHFNLRKSDHSEIRNRLNEQLRTRRKSDKHPQAGPPEIQLLNPNR
ncbi:uncharacterized protein [Dendropsophus ebraccatus]|uniref:uncharacterized protein isoform X2 n=1 Tax=Dendropsophus ebraccatus TaxID=150705 RepID=UPI00383147E5